MNFTVFISFLSLWSLISVTRQLENDAYTHGLWEGLDIVLFFVLRIEPTLYNHRENLCTKTAITTVASIAKIKISITHKTILLDTSGKKSYSTSDDDKIIGEQLKLESFIKVDEV